MRRPRAIALQVLALRPHASMQHIHRQVRLVVFVVPVVHLRLFTFEVPAVLADQRCLWGSGSLEYGLFRERCLI